MPFSYRLHGRSSTWCFSSAFSFQSVHALSPINRDLYHTGDGLIAEIKGLVRRHPGSLDLETWRAGNKGYSSEIFVVTYRHRGWKRDDDDDHKYRILLHGRELITSGIALRLLKILCGEEEMPSIWSASLNCSLVIKVFVLIETEKPSLKFKLMKYLQESALFSRCSLLPASNQNVNF